MLQQILRRTWAAIAQSCLVLSRTTSEKSTYAAKEKLTQRRRSLQSIYGTPSHKQPASVLLAIVETGLLPLTRSWGLAEAGDHRWVCARHFTHRPSRRASSPTPGLSVRALVTCIYIYVYMTMISEIQVDATWSSACNIQLVNAFRKKGFWVAAAFKLHFFIFSKLIVTAKILYLQIYIYSHIRLAICRLEPEEALEALADTTEKRTHVSLILNLQSRCTSCLTGPRPGAWEPSPNQVYYIYNIYLHK